MALARLNRLKIDAHEQHAQHVLDQHGIGFQPFHQRYEYDGYLSGQYRQLHRIRYGFR